MSDDAKPMHCVLDCSTGAVTFHATMEQAAAHDRSLAETAETRRALFEGALRDLLKATADEAEARFHLSNPTLDPGARAQHEATLAALPQRITDGIAIVAEYHPAMAADLQAIAAR